MISRRTLLKSLLAFPFIAGSLRFSDAPVAAPDWLPPARESLTVADLHRAKAMMISEYGHAIAYEPDPGIEEFLASTDGQAWCAKLGRQMDQIIVNTFHETRSPLEL